MAAIQQPAEMLQDGNMATNWREWKSAFEYYLIASGKDDATSKQKCALFLHVIGKTGRDILEEIDITETDKENYITLCQKFAEYCDPKKNVNYERHVFFETYQKEDTFEKFLGSLKVKSKNCEFGDLKTSLILTQLIRGLKDVHMKEKLLAKSSLTLEEATQWCRAAERAGLQASSCRPGVEVKSETDHKPLEAIFKKQLNETPARLQRLMLKLQHYCVELQYKPGKLLFIADTLSRATTEPGSEEIGQDVTIHVNHLYENVEATPEMLGKIKEETKNDQVLNALGEYYKRGWPNSKQDTIEIVRPYWDVHSELHVVNGILFRNDRVVMPGSLRKEMLRRIHEGHMGIEKCQRRAREVMWWPGMSAEIAQVVASCETCQRHRAANPREPLVPHPIPDRPWEIVAADIFELKGLNYLLVVDYYSKFMEIAPLKRLYSANIITALKMIFSRFGIPKRLVTDNGPQFTAEDFVCFSKSWEFEHVTSSPHYPRSNGLAERNVQTIKSIMVKAQESGEDWQIGLLNFRNTPVTGEDYSPAQLLMSRQLRTRLPAVGNTLDPKVVNKENVMVDRRRRIEEYKYDYDKGTRNLLPLNDNESIRMRSGKVWVNSKVINKARGERSYWVQTENGNVLRRNRQHLQKLPRSHYNSYRVPNVEWEDVVSNSDQRQSLLLSGTGSVQSGLQPVFTRSGRVIQAPRRLIEEC